VRTRTVSPSTHPRPASGGATDFLPASALSYRQQALRPPGGEDARCVQPMSATQTNRVHPHLARSRLTLATFAAGMPHGDSGSVGLTGGPDASRHPRPLRRIVALHLLSHRLPHGLRTRAWAFSSHGDERDRASGTPVAISASPLASAAFAAAATSPCVLFPCVRGRFRAGRRGRLPPRPPLMPSRERRRLVMIRDAFRRWGPFVGSGGHYSPGPATPPPLLAMWEPLDDDLSPPWALRRSSPVSSGEADSRRAFRST
jgi:hypothetical protein